MTTSAGRFLADAVFLATSLYGDPYRPRCAERVPDFVAQVHSTEYRNAAALPPGAVIVVGAGQSGAQIAEDLHLDGRKVHLVTGNAPRCARFYRGRDVVDWLTDIGQYEITVADEGMGRKRQDTNHYLTGRDGGRDIDLRAFAQQGMSLYGRLNDVRDGRMVFEPNLKANLDEADRVYNGINALIDRHIAAKGIDAPPGSVYQPAWIAERGARGPRSRRKRRRRHRLGDRLHARLVLCPAADLRRLRLPRESARGDERARRVRAWASVALDLGVRAFPERWPRRRVRCRALGSGAGHGLRGLASRRSVAPAVGATSEGMTRGISTARCSQRAYRLSIFRLRLQTIASLNTARSHQSATVPSGGIMIKFAER